MRNKLCKGSTLFQVLVLTERKKILFSFGFRGHPFSTYTKFSEKLIFLTPLIRTRTCTYQGVRNVTFSENFAYVLNGWPLKYARKCCKGFSPIFRCCKGFIPRFQSNIPILYPLKTPENKMFFCVFRGIKW